MTKRILLAGVAAGIAMFVWDAIAHMATPLGPAGLKTFRDESVVLSVLSRTVQESGLACCCCCTHKDSRS